MLYRKSVGESLHHQVNEELNDHINNYLTVVYNLDTTNRDKPVMNVDDIYLVLYYLWIEDTSVFPDERQRLQLAILLQLQAYTASRPAALVYKEVDAEKLKEHYLGWENDSHLTASDFMDLDMDDIKTICYRDVTLILLPNPEGGRDVLAMEVTLRFTKGWEKRPNPKTFILTEVDALIFDAIFLIIKIVLLDDAFDANVRSVEDIYRIRVKPPRRSYDFHWKEEKKDIPIFRQPVMTEDGLRTSDTMALRYHTYLYYLQRLGVLVGFMQLLVSYMIRRGAGEAVEAVGTQAQLQQVMSHRDAGIFQAYINQRVQCHVQAAFLGQPSAKALLKAVTHMSRHVDPRAPTGLTAEAAAELRLDPEVGKLKELRDHLSREVQSQSGTIKKAEQAGTKLYQMYKKASDALRCAKQKLVNSAKKCSRTQYFNTIDTIEINKQLEDHTQLGLDADEWTAPVVEHQLKERQEVASLIPVDMTQLDDQTKVEHRIRTGNALLALCRKKEPPRRRKPARSEPAPPPASQTCAKTQCIFCFRNGNFHHFSSVYKARDHVEVHLSTYREDDSIPCPEGGCAKKGTLLQGRMHCKSHLAQTHDYDIFARR